MARFKIFKENGTDIVIDLEKIVHAVPNQEKTTLKLQGESSRFIVVDTKFEEFSRIIGASPFETPGRSRIDLLP